MNNTNNTGGKLGFIGAGNMATAMMSGIVSGGIINANDIMMSDISEERLSFISERYGVGTTSDNKTIAKECGTLILAVKPQYYTQVITEIAPFVTNEQIIIETQLPDYFLSVLSRLGPILS